MGSGDWFRSIISLRKVKTDRSKRAKVHTTEKSNEAKGTNHTITTTTTTTTTTNESSNVANGGSKISPRVPGKSVEERAATRIQTAFRAFMARKKVHRLKGAVRFNVLIQGHTAQKQATTTLSQIHSWCNIQAQIRARRHCMVTEGRIKQKKMENQLKLEAKLHDLEVEWCGGGDTMEEILSRIQQREEAAVKRERAMAYAFSHQWRANSSQYLGQAYYTIGKENWGWSWKERWIAARPWEIRVNDQPNNPNKGQTRQLSKLDKATNQPEIKPSLSVKTALPNGKGIINKAKKLPSSTADNQALQDPNARISSSRIELPSSHGIA